MTIHYTQSRQLSNYYIITFNQVSVGWLECMYPGNHPDHLNQRWARDPGESLNHSDPPLFFSLDPSLEKGIGVLKVSIPVWKRDCHSESLDPSLDLKNQASLIT